MKMMNDKTRLLDRSRGHKLRESFRKCFIFIAAAVFILSATPCFKPVAFTVERADAAAGYSVTI